MKTKNLLQSLTLAFAIVSQVLFAQKSDEKSKALISALKEVNGGYKTLWDKNDVEYTYEYNSIGKGKDISTERHLFNGEHSWATYQNHKVHVFPKQEGTVVQSYVDGKAKTTLKGINITNDKALWLAKFLREVNFYWFSMMYKLDDPGTILKHLGTEVVNGVTYDKVSLNYNGDVTKKEVDDAYILYFNPSTHLVDLFYFSLPAMGVNKAILKMTLDYKVVDGVYLSTVRKSYAPNKKGEYQQNGTYTITNLKFNNGFTKKDLEI